MSMRSRPLILVATLATALVAGTVATPPAAANDRVVIVQPGQTLSQIAAANGVSVARLAALNHIADPNRIYAGQRLQLRPAPKAAPRRAQAVTHRVAYGETLTGIAARYGTSVDLLARRNRLADASRIYVGQLLRISGRQPGNGSHRQPGRTPARPSFGVHRVRSGETLSGIALRYRVSMPAIAEANHLANTSFIRTGQELRIPRATGPGGARNQRAPHRAAPSVRMPSAMATLTAARAGIRRIIGTEARRQGVPTAFALAVAWQESGWQPRVVSSAGAVGVMQLLPATGDWVSSTMLGERVNLWDPHSNVRAGVRLLSHYLDRYHGDRSLALAAYYQGQAATDRYGIFPVSRPYIASILLLQRMFRG
jgi:LysM repeat protein